MSKRARGNNSGGVGGDITSGSDIGGDRVPFNKMDGTGGNPADYDTPDLYEFKKGTRAQEGSKAPAGVYNGYYTDGGDGESRGSPLDKWCKGAILSKDYKNVKTGVTGRDWSGALSAPRAKIVRDNKASQ